jgi:hypothetical protein
MDEAEIIGVASVTKHMLEVLEGEDDLDVPMLDPITYHGNEKVLVHYEGLCDRLERINQTLTGAPQIESTVRQTFETRLAEMIAAVRPGLREYRYVDLSAKISELEREISSRMRLRQA